MGAVLSDPAVLNGKISRSIKGEMLVAELTGTISEDDYTARAYTTLQNTKHVIPAVPSKVASNYLELSRCYELLQPGYMQLEHGYCRGPGGVWYIACLTDLGDCNGEMFDYWYRVCDSSEKFKWWHPRDHISGDWDVQFFAVQPGDRTPGYYINHVHHVVERIGDKPQSLTFDYDRPSKYFDVTNFAQAGVTACVCARIHRYDPCVGWINIGHVIHIVREVDGRSELRSRFWIGDVSKVEDESVCHPGCVNYWANTSATRYIQGPNKIAQSIMLHCAEEMTCLKAFLPDFYKKSIDQGLVFGQGDQSPTENFIYYGDSGGDDADAVEPEVMAVEEIRDEEAAPRQKSGNVFFDFFN